MHYAKKKKQATWDFQNQQQMTDSKMELLDK